MIRHAWHELTATDSALRAGEWAGVRVSTANERKHVQAGRRDLCNTFVFRQCGAVLRLVVTEDIPEPSFASRRRMERVLAERIAEKRLNLPEPYSVVVLSIAASMGPDVLPDLERVQRNMRCDNCTCIVRNGGPIDADSPQGAFVRHELSASQFAKRNAANGG